MITTTLTNNRPSTIIDNSIGNSEIERVGSIVAWTLNNQSSISWEKEQAQYLFAGTILEDVLVPPKAGEAASRLGHKLAQRQKLDDLKNQEKIFQKYSFVSKAQEYKKEFILSIFGGDAEKDKSDLKEFLRIHLFYEAETDSHHAVILEQSPESKISEKEILKEWIDAFKIIHLDLSKAIAAVSEQVGYQLGYGSNYFVPLSASQGFYEIKKRIENNSGGEIQIMPLFAGSTQDIEFLISVIGKELAEKSLSAEISLFETAISHYGFIPLWIDFREALAKQDFAKACDNKLARSAFGGYLLQHLMAVANNSTLDEYDEIANGYFKRIKPPKVMSLESRILKNYAAMRETVAKLKATTQNSKHLQAFQSRFEDSLKRYNSMLKKISTQTISKTLSILSELENSL